MKIVTHKNGVRYLRSDIISSPHGFSTRLGGVSENKHTEWLNLAFDRGDSRETVLENLRLFCDAVGFSAERLVSLGQIHSSRVIYVDEDMAGEGYFLPDSEKCDGYVTDKVGMAVGVKTADCLPILLEGISDDGEAVAVGALHAGWRGTVGGIAEKGVKAMMALGVRGKNIRAALGPAICAECYEVREDFRDAFKAAMGAEMTERYVIPDKKKVGVFHTDLRRINRDILLLTGVPEENIDVCPLCTYCHPELFYSHRYSNGERGSLLSVVSLGGINPN